jgi:ribosomal protein S18 acetylase RimI-like enzyme
MLLTTTELATRAMRADLVYTIQRMQVIANREGNPFGIATRVFGAATALAATRLPSSRFNRAVGLNPAETASLQDILAWYAELGPSPQIEITPGDLNKSLANALAGVGFRQTSFHASLVGAVAEAPSIDVAIRSVETSETLERFLDVYLAGWEFPLAIHEGAKVNMRGWLGPPGWHLYLAEIEGQPAAVAILFLHENVAYFADTCVHPDYRGRHLQSALLAALPKRRGASRGRNAVQSSNLRFHEPSKYGAGRAQAFVYAGCVDEIITAHCKDQELPRRALELTATSGSVSG